jgi:selenocysteine lyase/cysteine desulfurase
MTPLFDWATSHGYAVMSGGCAYHLVGIRPLHLTPQQMIDVCDQLQEAGIYIAVRCGAFRISPYIDNYPQDIDRLIAALSES